MWMKCDSVRFPCPLECSNDDRFDSFNLKFHLKKCPKQKVKCLVCETDFLYRDKDIHNCVEALKKQKKQQDEKLTKFKKEAKLLQQMIIDDECLFACPKMVMHAKEHTQLRVATSEV